MLAHFVDAVANDTPVEPFGATFFDGMRAAQVADAARRGRGRGTEVEVAGRTGRSPLRRRGRSASDGGPGPSSTIEHVSKRFPGVQALDDVSLTLAAGEVHGLVGQNGAGKSTLVKCITGVHAPDAGRIVLDGEPITTYMPKHAYDLGIAVVHQRTQLIPWLSVAENVLLGHLPTFGGAVILRGEANRVTRDAARALPARHRPGDAGRAARRRRSASRSRSRGRSSGARSS